MASMTINKLDFLANKEKKQQLTLPCVCPRYTDFLRN